LSMLSYVTMLLCPAMYSLLEGQSIDIYVQRAIGETWTSCNVRDGANSLETNP
jgi:hypothetical protein